MDCPDVNRLGEQGQNDEPCDIGADGTYSPTDAAFTIAVTGAKATVLSAAIEETAVANRAVVLTVVTDTAAVGLRVQNEFGANMGIAGASYQDVDGQRIWTVTTRIGTCGTRTLHVAAKNKYGDLSEFVSTNQVVVKAF